MDKIVIAFGNDNNRNRIAELLEMSGFNPKRLCKTGKDAIRAIRAIGGGIVICGYKLVDMTADDLAYDIDDIALTLVIAQPTLLELCENESLCKLPTPVKRTDLISSVNMLISMEENKIAVSKPKRSDEERELIQQAKQILMDKCAMTEPEAHRFIQKKSMDSGFKLISTARLIINSYN